ncbi:MAG: hypothetical protein RR965_03115, partial [Enterococcus sp.]
MELDKFRDVDLVVDHVNDSFFSRQFVSQNDNDGRTLTVLITNGGVVGEVPGLSVNLRWSNQASGLTDLSAFELIDKATSKFQIKYPKNMLNPGKVIASIQIIQNGQVAHSKQFEITVQQLAGEAKGIVSKSEYSALVSVLANSNKFRTDIEILETNKADKTQVSQVEDMISKMPSATPQETFASLSALQTKYPNGNASAMVVLEADGKTGYVYLWTGTVWQKGALYQSQGLQERSVTLPILADKAVAREKTDFLTPVFVNYANFSVIEDNGCYVDSGVWTARTDVLSMSLSLEIGTTYVKKWFHTTETGGTFTTFWDASGTFISGTNTSEFTVPASTKTTKIAVFKSVRAKTALLKKEDKYLFTDYKN